MPRTWRQLGDALQTSGEDVVEMSFGEVSALVGDLETSDIEDRGLWTKDKAHAKAWLDVGYRVETVDAAQGVVRFKKA